jgi:crotonobetainyl-CoA:carnitine CoA-transferase CaiB-like acyl-CoA transferase
MAAAVEQVAVRFHGEGIVSERTGDLHWLRGYKVFPCADGHVVLSWNRNWEHVVALLAADTAEADLANPAFTPESVTAEHMEHVADVLAAWARSRTKADIAATGQAFRLPWAEAASPADVLANQQLAARGFLSGALT